MNKEKNNFARAVDWLIENGEVKEQKEIADRMGTTPATISRIKNGFVKHPDQETIRKFGKSFGKLINIAYIRGESDVMLVADLPQATAPVGVEFSKDATTAALLAAKDETIAALRSQLAEKDGRISDKDEVIASKDALITTLQQQLATLRAQLAIEKGVSEESGSILSELVERQSRSTHTP